MSSPLAIYLWQRTLSPHSTGLIRYLPNHGITPVLVYNEELAETRRSLGWMEDRPTGITVLRAPDATTIAKIVDAAPPDAVHIVEGLARNGLVGHAIGLLRKRRERLWVRLETLDDSGWKGLLRRIEYRLRFMLAGLSVERYLAIGRTTTHWLTARGIDPARISPFTYFLPEQSTAPLGAPPSGPTRFLYVGQLIHRKRVGDILSAMSLNACSSSTLTVVGDGPLRASLEQQAQALLPGRTNFCGVLPIDNIRLTMRHHDVLILPSRHDGWGAVVSEALMEGTRVICSDRCGASLAAYASTAGRVFTACDVRDLAASISAMAKLGRVMPDERESTARWARAFTASAGAAYLAALIQKPTTRPPWELEQQ